MLAQHGSGDVTRPGTSGSGWSMVGSEQHLRYTLYIRGVWPSGQHSAGYMSRGTNIKLRAAEEYATSRARIVGTKVTAQMPTVDHRI
jgi:hypothetical protein